MLRKILVLLVVTAALLIAAAQTHPRAAAPAEAAFPGENGKIAFTASNGKLTTVNADGSGLETLGNGSGANWSPDGSKIAFQNAANGTNFDIFVMNEDGSGTENVTNDPAFDAFPGWSPDGNRIAFLSIRGGESQIWVMNADGTNPQQVTTFQRVTSGARWSPDGSELLFAGNREPGEGGIDLYAIHPDGTGVRNVTNTPNEPETGVTNVESWANWSPDGTKIVFSARYKPGGFDHIYVINADGGGRQQLTNSNSPLEDISPAWSPDGSKIAYARYEASLPSELRLINADGSGDSLLLNSGSGAFLDWQPLGGQCSGTAAVASPTTDEDADGDNIPDNVENNITHTDPNCQDTDGDGLLDPWEVPPGTEGAGFDLDGDGDAEVQRDAVFGPYAGACLDLTGPRFERLGQHCGLVHEPDPLHKDVYIEMDWQDCFEGNCPELVGIAVDPSHHAPDMAGLLNVVNMFRNAPVENPDGVDGVNLHILVDEALKHIHNCDQAPAATRATNFGTEDQRDDAQVIQAKTMAFRYAWSGHSSIKDDTTNDCALPSLFVIALAGAGLGPLPYYDTSPAGHALPGGRDVLVTLAVSWICQLYSFNAPSAIGNFPPCFRKIIGIATVIVPGLFPADIALPNGGSEEVALPMHMLLGIPPAAAVEQLWGRTFAHYLGTALGVPEGSLGNNPRTTGAQPVNSYGNWDSVSYAPPSGLPVQSLTSAGGSQPELILPDYTLADHDQDGDGTIEKDDNCPAFSNTGQSDIDGDGAGDACDDDPDNDGLIGSADAQPNDTDNDGTPNATDADDDDDSLSDIDDNCPVVINAGQENADADAFGDVCDTDSDGDGLPNSFEALVGTDPGNPVGTPEFVGNGNSCTDAQDNDGDGATDAADGGCQDPDGDTVPSSIDNCPDLLTNNLLDSDLDGTGDACEPVGDPHLWGDNDCDGSISSRDNQALSRFVLQQNPLSQTQPCPLLGATVTVTGAGTKAWGDLDCDNQITSRDGQALLRNILQQNPLSQTQPCPVLGDPVTTQPAAARLEFGPRIRWWP